MRSSFAASVYEGGHLPPIDMTSACPSADCASDTLAIQEAPLPGLVILTCDQSIVLRRASSVYAGIGAGAGVTGGRVMPAAE